MSAAAITSSRGSVRGVEGGVERVLESIRSLDRKQSTSLTLQKIEEVPKNSRMLMLY